MAKAQLFIKVWWSDCGLNSSSSSIRDAQDYILCVCVYNTAMKILSCVEYVGSIEREGGGGGEW